MSNKWELTSGYGRRSDYKSPRQNIRMVQVSGPTLSILTTAEVKNYLKMGSDTTDDNLISDLIKSTAKMIEHECGGLCICEQTWKQYQKGGVETIELQRSPLIGTPTVSYYDDFEDTVPVNITYSSYFRVVENELHHLDGFFEQGRDGDGYTITFKTGLFTASTYTSSDKQELQILKTAQLRAIAFLYENREKYITAISEGNWSVTYNAELPIDVKTFIMPLHTGNGLL